jgi:hypothetical protein
VEDDFRNTYAEGFYMTLYHKAHPYAPPGVGNLVKKIGFGSTPAHYISLNKKV